MTQQDLDDARLHAMLDHPHAAHAIAALTDDEIAEDAAALDPDTDDADDTDVFDGDDADEAGDEFADPEGDAQ